MKEDIEILEMDLNDIVDYLGKQVSFEYGQIIGTAIENLLTRLKDYEQIEKEHQKENGELREKVKELEEDYTSIYLSGIYDEREKWISKIKENIEVRKQSINDIQDNFIINEGMLGEIKRLEDEITVLQALLEENK